MPADDNYFDMDISVGQKDGRAAWLLAWSSLPIQFVYAKSYFCIYRTTYENLI